MSQNNDAIPAGPQLTIRQKLRMVMRMAAQRIRFIAILAGVGLFIGNWDSIKSHWDRWTHYSAAASRELPSGQEFYCPMHAQVIQTNYAANGDVPNCSICGMPLVIRAQGTKEKLPPGVTGHVHLSAERIAMAGIKTTPVGYRPMAKQIQTVGYVTFDETGLSRIVSRVDGYVEKLYVDKSYSIVHKGDPLAEIYSPELYSTARELVLASKEQGGSTLANSARHKLLLLGVSPEDIDSMVASGIPSQRIMIRSTQSGHVLAKKIVEGASVDAKMTLFEIADLSTVWIEAEVFENDIPFLKAGQDVEATFEAYPNRTFKGTLALIHPHLDLATRTNQVRFKLDNPDHELRPGMFASVKILSPLDRIEPYKTLAAKTARTVPVSQKDGSTRPQQEFLVVPEQAVVDTGAKKVVFVERQEGEFEGIEVELGPRLDGYFPVLKGLAAGDQVASAGGFLLDAETRLNPAAASVYFGASGGSAPPVRQGESRNKVTETKPAAVVPSEEDLKNIEQLAEGDRLPAKTQGFCPVKGIALGSMGVPVKMTLRGKTVFVCCKNCIGKARLDPDGTLKKLEAK